MVDSFNVDEQKVHVLKRKRNNGNGLVSEYVDRANTVVLFLKSLTGG